METRSEYLCNALTQSLCYHLHRKEEKLAQCSFSSSYKFYLKLVGNLHFLNQTRYTKYITYNWLAIF